MIRATPILVVLTLLGCQNASPEPVKHITIPKATCTALLGEETQPLETAMSTGLLRTMVRDMEREGYHVELRILRKESSTVFYFPDLSPDTAPEICNWATRRWGWHKCEVTTAPL